MSTPERVPGLSRPGAWLARVAMPARPVSRWGMTWRLTARLLATTVMTAITVLVVWAAATSPRETSWVELSLAILGWVYSVALTVGITVVMVRGRRAKRRRDARPA